MSASSTTSTTSDPAAGAHPQELELTTGEQLRGDLLGFASRDRPRLSDLLNSGDAFLPLLAAGRTLYVNLEAIGRVRALD